MTPYASGKDWTLYHGNCLEILPTLSGIDAVVTDPPYGIGADEAASKNKGKWWWKFYGNTQWDRKRPPREIFDLIIGLRVPTLIWGGNYFTDLLPPRMGWMAWDKGQRGFSLADFEMAWTSEQKASRCVVYSRSKANSEGKVHPTQKPVPVMEECISFLQRGRKKAIGTVLDPFTGSGTTGVACIRTGRKFIGIEIDEGYCEIAAKRLREAEASLLATA